MIPIKSHTRSPLFAELLPARYILAVLGCISMAIIYGLKVNLSVAMVAMLNHTALAHESGHGTTPANGTFSTDVEPECQGSGDAELVEVIFDSASSHCCPHAQLICAC